MDDLTDWFTREIRGLGFAGLEGVYGYLATMSDEQVLEYLESLLGSEKRVTEFAKSYIQRRSHGMPSEATTVSQDSSSDTVFDWSQTSRAASKAKRNKGKHSHRERKSFATVLSKSDAAVPKSSTSALSTEQAKAIRDAPVERIRQQLLEYRRNRRPVNCIHCGKIECPVPEDGVCSFCRSSIFSIWQPSEQRQGAVQTRSEGEAVPKTVHKERLGTKYCTVLGRYVRRPTPYQNVYVQPVLRDLAGRTYRSALPSNKEESKNIAQSSTTSDPRSSNSVHPKLKDHSEIHMKESTRFRKRRFSSHDRDFAVQGRLLVDDLRPSACLPNT